MAPRGQSIRMPEFILRVPEGDDRERMMCADCGHIAYENPKIVVGAVVAAAAGILMCRRAIEPRRGFWTLPAGYLEMHETVEEGAAREAWEEAEARIVIGGLLGMFSISRIGQVHIFYHARFANDGMLEFAPGPESLDVQLMQPADIPWDEVAFPTTRWALDAWQDQQGKVGFQGAPVGNPVSDPRGIHRYRNPGMGVP